MAIAYPELLLFPVGGIGQRTATAPHHGLWRRCRGLAVPSHLFKIIYDP